MKKALVLIPVIGIAVILLAIGCCFLYAMVLDIITKPAGCSPLPDGFSEADLIGTWVAGTPDQSDTLIIKADGTYKQIVHVEFAELSPLDYESDWQSWRLEYSEQHIGYLHLEGFRFCGMNPDIPCEERNGGGYDFCRDETIYMENEGVLLVLTEKERQSSTIEASQYLIWLAYPLGSENSWTYNLQEP